MIDKQESVKDTLDFSANLTPVERVIDDMYSDSVIAWSARDYYFIRYATEQEKEEIRKQEKIEFIFACCFIVLPFFLGFLFLLKELLIKNL